MLYLTLGAPLSRLTSSLMLVVVCLFQGIGGIVASLLFCWIVSVGQELQGGYELIIIYVLLIVPNHKGYVITVIITSNIPLASVRNVANVNATILASYVPIWSAPIVVI